MDETIPIPAQLTRIAHLARTGDCGAAASQTNMCMASIQEALSQSPPSPDWMEKLKFSLETLLMMQEQEDWVAFADVAEFELAPLWEKRA